MYEPIKFPTKSGAEAPGELVAPEGVERAPAVVLIQEWWGLNGQIRHVAARLAREGFLVAIPDLYHGRWTVDPAEAQKLMEGLDWPRALDEIGSAAAYLKTHPRSNGHVGVIGFCLGGALSFASATLVPELEAVVPFYGLAPSDKFDYAKVKAPILAHFASQDEWARADNARAVMEQMQSRGQSMELHVYEAGHAFAHESRKDVYVPEAAALAWSRSIAFLHRHLG
ncbi:dienelactone hydrolase family protein [Polyangium fumosum]|uniref:Dienelactone hydrolase family protein n=1 Tax=Polyangium fumosum TaxID=889272 RepID=A0A4U1J938_9BACT|nr:dienelactone hydrolase family protein [Polyangium fumosum]TKD04508.1 dienelactone hydrolase family protein [Polyangium fumosum]